MLRWRHEGNDLVVIPTHRPHGARTRSSTWLGPYLYALAHDTGNAAVDECVVDPERRWLEVITTLSISAPVSTAIPVVTRGASSDHDDAATGESIDWRDGTLKDGRHQPTLPAPLTELPLLLVDGVLIPMLDPTNRQLAPVDYARRP